MAHKLLRETDVLECRNSQAGTSLLCVLGDYVLLEHHLFFAHERFVNHALEIQLLEWFAVEEHIRIDNRRRVDTGLVVPLSLGDSR